MLSSESKTLVVAAVCFASPVVEYLGPAVVVGAAYFACEAAACFAFAGAVLVAASVVSDSVVACAAGVDAVVFVAVAVAFVAAASAAEFDGASAAAACLRG